MDLFGEPPPEEKEALGNLENENPIMAGAPPTNDLLFTHPRHMDFCTGHHKVEQALLESFNTGRMPHGLIFSGQKGIGKATMAYRLARFLFTHGISDPNQGGMFDAPPSAHPLTLDVDPNGRAFRQVSSGGHADLLTIERVYDAAKNKTQETLPVAELRKVEPFLRMTASEGGWRVVIIDDADTMNRNAQNALLKILEEPPANVVIILIAHRVGALIPTIRSRTRTLSFDTLTPETITDLMGQKGTYIDPFQGETLAAIAEGSFGRALNLLEEGGLEMLAQILSLINPEKDIDWPALHPFADQMARVGQDKEYKNFTAILLWLYKILAFAKARGQPLKPQSLNDAPLNDILQNSSLAQLLEICENLSTCFDRTQYANLDKRQAVLKAFQIINA